MNLRRIVLIVEAKRAVHISALDVINLFMQFVGGKLAKKAMEVVCGVLHAIYQPKMKWENSTLTREMPSQNVKD